MQITNEDIKNAILQIAGTYPVLSVILFGSRANGTNRPDSDVDLIMEFYSPVSILTLSEITCRLEEILHLDVDVIHGPVKPDDMIETGAEVLLYAA